MTLQPSHAGQGPPQSFPSPLQHSSCPLLSSGNCCPLTRRRFSASDHTSRSPVPVPRCPASHPAHHYSDLTCCHVALLHHQDAFCRDLFFLLLSPSTGCFFYWSHCHISPARCLVSDPFTIFVTCCLLPPPLGPCCILYRHISPTVHSLSLSQGCIFLPTAMFLSLTVSFLPLPQFSGLLLSLPGPRPRLWACCHSSIQLRGSPPPQPAFSQPCPSPSQLLSALLLGGLFLGPQHVGSSCHRGRAGLL